jgi:hypothetical protein
MEHKRSTAAPVAIAVLLLLPVLYVGSYLGLTVESQLVHPGGGVKPYWSSRYRINGVERLFWPLERLDPRMRRDSAPPSTDPFDVQPSAETMPSSGDDPFAEQP